MMVERKMELEISIHALREEGDCSSLSASSTQPNFYPRPPRGGRHDRAEHAGDGLQFLSTPSARRATRCCPRGAGQPRHFYPRPPRGGRRAAPKPSRHRSNFYPRPPRGGRRILGIKAELAVVISIHALREEGDRKNLCVSGIILYFYPRPPRGGRRAAHLGAVQPDTISIHALREEGDMAFPPFCRSGETFLSTPSARRATWFFMGLPPLQKISIHALREEGDLRPLHRGRRRMDFYPRPPRGGRPASSSSCTASSRFLSTPSARRATIRITLRM